MKFDKRKRVKTFPNKCFKFDRTTTLQPYNLETQKLKLTLFTAFLDVVIDRSD